MNRGCSSPIVDIGSCTKVVPDLRRSDDSWGRELRITHLRHQVIADDDYNDSMWDELVACLTINPARLAVPSITDTWRVLHATKDKNRNMLQTQVEPETFQAQIWRRLRLVPAVGFSSLTFICFPTQDNLVYRKHPSINHPLWSYSRMFADNLVGLGCL